MRKLFFVCICLLFILLFQGNVHIYAMNQNNEDIVAKQGAYINSYGLRNMNEIDKTSMFITDVCISLIIVVALFVLFKHSINKKLDEEIIFARKSKKYRRIILIVIPVFIVVAMYSVWELISNEGFVFVVLFRLAIFSFLFYIPYQFVITKNGLYHVTRFGGAAVICSMKQFKDCFLDSNGSLTIHYIDTANEKTTVSLRDKYSEDEFKEIKKILMSGGNK